VRIDEQRDLSATEDDGIAATVLEALDHVVEVEARFFGEDAVDQFLEDDVVDAFALVGVGDRPVRVPEVSGVRGRRGRPSRSGCR